MKRYLYTASVTGAAGTQTFYVDAKTRAQADQLIQGGGDIYAHSVEVTDLSTLEFEGVTAIDDFGDFPPDVPPAASRSPEMLDFELLGRAQDAENLLKRWLSYGRACIADGYPRPEHLVGETERLFALIPGPGADPVSPPVATSTPECQLPPPGWRCTRGAGHDGPCAAERKPMSMDEITLGAYQQMAENCVKGGKL